MMDTGLNTNKLKWTIRVSQPPESWLDRIQREIHQEQNNDTKLDQDFVAPALCHIPPVNCGTGHSFRGHRTMPYAYCGSECQRERERAPALRENAFWSRVLGRTERDPVGIVRRSERMKEFEEAEGRPKDAVEPRKLSNRGRKTEMHRWTEKTALSLNRCWEQGAQAGYFTRKGWLLCSILQFFNEIVFWWRNSSILNHDESTMTWVNVLTKERRELRGSSRHLKENSTRTGQLDNEESRFRGTRTMPYAYWGSECQSRRAPA